MCSVLVRAVCSATGVLFFQQEFFSSFLLNLPAKRMVWGSKVRFNAKVEQVLFRRRPSYDRFPSDGVECPLGMARKCWHRGYVPLRSASPELPRRFRSVPSLQSQQRKRLLGRVPEETPHSTDEEENEEEEKVTKRKRLRKKGGEGEEQVLKTEKGKRSHSEQKRKRQEEEEEENEDQQQEGNEGEGEKKVKRRKKEEEEKVEEENVDGKENQRENAERGEQQLKKRKKKKAEEKETGRQQVEEQGGEEKRKRKKKKKIPKRPLEENGEQETNTKRKREGKDNRRLINTEEKDQRSQVKEDERGEAELAKIVWEMQQSGCSCVGRCHPRTCECLQADIPCCHAWLPDGRSGCNCSSETCCNTDERRAEGRHDRRREHYRDTVSRVYNNEYFPNDSSDEDEDRPPRWPTDDEDDDETIDEVK